MPFFYVQLRLAKFLCDVEKEKGSPPTERAIKRAEGSTRVIPHGNRDTSDFLLRQWERGERRTAMREVKDLLLLLLLSSGSPAGAGERHAS
jgi:hypothetical protein